MALDRFNYMELMEMKTVNIQTRTESALNAIISCAMFADGSGTDCRETT